MYRRIHAALLAAVLVGCGLLAWVGQTAAQGDGAVQERLTLARQILELLAMDETARVRPDVERLAQWLRRVLETELELKAAKPDRVAAYEAHLDRMKDQAVGVETQYRAGTITRADALADKYFEIEARAWMRKAQGQ